MIGLACGQYGHLDRGPKAVWFDAAKDQLVDSQGCRGATVHDSWPALRFLYPSVWEKTFDCNNFMNWAKEHWILPLVLCAVYVVFCFTTRAVMRDRTPFSLRGPLIAWNLLLSVFSAIGFLRTAPHLFNTAFTHGFQNSVCMPAEQSYSMGAAGFWTMLFIYSKVPELIDTVFIVLKKNKLIFLHWYHHVTVLLFCWHSYATRSSAGLYFVAMNYGVHALMYFYYCLTAMGYRPKWASLVTTLQIAQMFGGMAICGAVAWYKWGQKKPCDTTDENLTFGSLLYASYAILFIAFALQKYCNPAPPRSAKAGAAVSSSSSSSSSSSVAGKQEQGNALLKDNKSGNKKAQESSSSDTDNHQVERDPSPSPSNNSESSGADDPSVANSIKGGSNSSGGARRRKHA